MTCAGDKRTSTDTGQQPQSTQMRILLTLLVDNLFDMIIIYIFILFFMQVGTQRLWQAVAGVG
jgi:hypothetical protein